MKITHKDYKDIIWTVTRSTPKMFVCTYERDVPMQDFATGEQYTEKRTTHRKLKKSDCEVVL